jgi:hypothetical protein
VLLTEAQLYQIRQIVADHHSAFIVNTISPSAVAPEVLQALKDKGLVNVQVNSIEDAYLYGQVLAMMDDPKFANMSYEQFKQHIQKNPIPLSPIEIQAVNFAQQQAGQYCRGLGNRVDSSTGQILIEADAALRQQLRDTIKTKTAENVAKRESLKKLKSELGWATRDWARDWQRIANTEKQNAMQRGVADHYGKRYGGDVFVSKRPMPDACKHCKRLHLGPDGQPRIFKLSELEANGTNVGRKAAEWLPVVGTVHPHCQCQMVRVPDGWGYDEQGSLVPGGEFGVRYQSEEDLQLAMLQEMDLQKAFKLQGHTQFQGIPIAIENKVGSVRKWRDGQGGEGETRMLHAYGYIKRTVGADEDEIDVFLGPDPRANQAYIIHQRNVHTDIYDEDKTMLGFSNEKDAMAAFQDNYDRSDFIITCSVMDMDAFKRWIQGTDSAPGEMFKSGTGGIRYVIPLERLEKAGPYVGPRGGKWADPKHTIPWKEGAAARTGALKIDHEDVRATADQLLSHLKTTKHGVIPGQLQPSVIDKTFKDPRGRDIPVQINLIPKSGIKDIRGIKGSAANAVVFDAQGKAQLKGVQVQLRVSEHPGQDKDVLAKKVRDVLSHELTHALDPSIQEKSERLKKEDVYLKAATANAKQRGLSRSEYLNQKEEVTASLQQITRDLLDKPVVDELREARDEYAQDPDFPAPMRPEELLEYYSDRWGMVGEHYTPENRKRVLKAVSQLRDAILEDRIEGIQKSMTAMLDTVSTAARGPVSGTASNYQTAVKPRSKAKAVEGLKENLEEIGTDPEGEAAVKRDKEVYIFQEPQRYVRPVKLPDDFKSDALQAGETKERRKNTERFMIQNRGVTKNKAELTKAEGPGSGVTPIGGVTPGGYKKVAKGVYVKQDPHEFAAGHGGKIVDHFSDPKLKVLKIPKTKVETLKKFKAQHGIAAEVGVGGKYAMVNLTMDELAQLKEYQAEKKPTKKKPKKAAEPELKPPVSDDDIQRLGEITLVPESELEPPKVAPWVKQHGREVKFSSGEKGTVIGSDKNGMAVVKVGSQVRRNVPWQELKSTTQKAYKPAYAGLPKEAFVRPDKRQQKLLDTAMAFNVIGKHKATEFTNWLRAKGQESYLVGGIVRDMVAGTMPGSKAPDSEILESMKDVDIVSTGQPQLGKLMMRKVATDVPNGGISYDGTKWGTVLASASGDSVGLDYASMAANYKLHSGQMVWDHSIEDDVTRRDFTCNSLFYDPHNKVIIDPSGKGIADAQNKVLRMSPSPEDALKNDRLHLRFWKFRIRGYSAEKKTLKHMRKQAEHWFGEYKSNPSRLSHDVFGAIGKKGGDINKHLADLEKVMKEDGCLDLFQKYIEPVRGAIIAKAKNYKG